MPLLASLAVMLCTAMVLTVWSVMGGFLATLVNSGRSLVGDVVLGWENVGFVHYQELVERLEKDPEIAAASPMIETYGLTVMPNGRRVTSVVKGIEPASFSKVTTFEETLWWKPLDAPVPNDKRGEDPRLREKELMTELLAQGRTLSRADARTGEARPAAAVGIGAAGMNWRTEGGYYEPQLNVSRTGPDGQILSERVFMPRNGFVTLNVVPVDKRGNAETMVSEKIPVANEFQSGIWEVDSRTIFVRLDLLQRLLNMHEVERLSEEGGSTLSVVKDPVTGQERIVSSASVVGKTPARVTHVVIRGKGSVGTPEEVERLALRCQEIYGEFAAAHRGEVPEASSVRAVTWRDLNATMIAAVQKERALVLFLFLVISLVAVFLILAIFWSMVAEKTKDIGTLRAVGAGRLGVAGVWVSYGLAIGVVGSALGVVLAYLVVLNINPIHEWLGKSLGIVIWDPRVYLFVRIPNQVRAADAVMIGVGSVVSSAVGALVPALRAAMMHPVKALRFE